MTPNQPSPLKVLCAVRLLANDLAGQDPNMHGSEPLKAHHYANALDLITRHLDPNHDIRWLEGAYKHWKKHIEGLLK